MAEVELEAYEADGSSTNAIPLESQAKVVKCPVANALNSVIKELCVAVAGVSPVPPDFASFSVQFRGIKIGAMALAAMFHRTWHKMPDVFGGAPNVVRHIVHGTMVGKLCNAVVYVLLTFSS
ncbi:hypothetical protein TRVL_07078 [Trypanosoma vivax]|nr:hypothetical protein TRVL_07078 [Trypanosoma vivax]